MIHLQDKTWSPMTWRVRRYRPWTSW